MLSAHSLSLHEKFFRKDLAASGAADTSNGENLLLIRHRRIAVSYGIEAFRIFGHCEFRVAQSNAKKGRKKLQLAKAPRKVGETAWWEEDYTNACKIRDREILPEFRRQVDELTGPFECSRPGAARPGARCVYT